MSRQSHSADDLPDPDQGPAAEPADTGLLTVLLEHLERIRWLIVRSLVAVLVGMVLCLVAADKIVGLLSWPLKQAQPVFRPAGTQDLSLQWGSNQLKRVTVPSGMFASGTDKPPAAGVLNLVPVQVGEHVVLGVRSEAVTSASGAGAGRMTLKNYSPVGPFAVAIQIAIYGGLVVSAPIVFYCMGRFLQPLLVRRGVAGDFLTRSAWLATGLFAAGVLFCYFVLLPVGLYGSMEFSAWLQFEVSEWQAEEYIGFVCKFMVGMGLAFQLPLVVLTLVKVGLIGHEQLKKFRAWCMVINLVISAMVTPDGNPLTMVLMALPLQILYETSVYIAGRWERQAGRAA